MAEDGALGNSRQEMMERFTRIPGLGRSRAEYIYDAGYTNVGLLRKASVEELQKIPGVGMSLARCVKNNLDRVREEAPAAVSVASAAPGPAQPERIVVGEGASPAQRPEAPAPDAQPAAPAQSRGFLSSIFDKLLGKPVPAQAAPDKKEGDGKEPEKKEPDKTGGVKVESPPAAKTDAGARPEEKKEAEKSEPGKDEPPKAEAPGGTATAGATPESKPNEIKVDSKPDQK